jgi:hypothetical protein
MATISSLDAARRSLVEEIVRRYLRSTRSGHEDEYQIEIPPEHGSGSILVVDAVHPDDLTAQGRGPSKSLQLQVDVEAGHVVRELAYQ